MTFYQPQVSSNDVGYDDQDHYLDPPRYDRFLPPGIERQVKGLVSRLGVQSCVKSREAELSIREVLKDLASPRKRLTLTPSPSTSASHSDSSLDCYDSEQTLTHSDELEKDDVAGAAPLRAQRSGSHLLKEISDPYGHLPPLYDRLRPLSHDHQKMW